LEGFDPKVDRYPLTAVRRSILEQSPHFKSEDLLPVPCHPDCLAMGYALKVDGKVIPLAGLVDPSTFLKLMPNSIVYEQDDTLKKKLFDLFSTGNSPAMSATKMEQLLCCLPLVAVPQGLTYENVFRILIVQFLDPYNFDVRSVKRSCIHMAQTNGQLIPFDTFNIFYRDGASGAHLVAGNNE
jgi:uncharacterized radical SAM superfamily Fe-S cluster-containing enzyme